MSETTSETIEQELKETRSELDETARALKEKLSAEHLLEQTRVYLGDGVHSAGALIRRHPIPAALAGVLLLGGIVGRMDLKWPSSSDDTDGTARHLLKDLLETTQRGSTRVKEAIEQSLESTADHDGGVLSRIEHLAQQVRRGAEHGARAAGPRSNRELALIGMIAMLLGATLRTRLRAQR